MIDYHPGKANVVADALIKKSMQTLRALNAHLSLSEWYRSGRIDIETRYVEQSARSIKDR